MMQLFEQDISIEPPIFYSSKNNEWYTPACYIKAARKVLGNIDVDPASNELANQVVKARVYYDEHTNGLDREWHGKVWLNPPYGYDGITRQKANVERWITTLIEQYQIGIVTEAILLVNATTNSRWFDPLWQFPICFASVRISFWNASGETGRPTHGNALVYVGSNEARFVEVFSQIGHIVRAIDVPNFKPTTLNLWENGDAS